MKKLLIKVYRDILNRGDYHREKAKYHQKLYGKSQNEEDYLEVEAQNNYGNNFYQCAAWLEETEEINPTK